MPFTLPQTKGGARPPLRLQRHRLEDLLSEHAEGFTGRVFWFHDISDEEAFSDRVVVGFYDEAGSKTITGTVVLSAPEGHEGDFDVRAFKEHLNSVWNEGEVYATVLPATEGSTWPRLVPAEKPADTE